MTIFCFQRVQGLGFVLGDLRFEIGIFSLYLVIIGEFRLLAGYPFLDYPVHICLSEFLFIIGHGFESPKFTAFVCLFV